MDPHAHHVPSSRHATAVQRGFATTSVVSKKAKEEAAAEEERQRQSSADASAAASTNATPGNATPAGGAAAPDGLTAALDRAGEPAKEDWEDEKAMEEAALQALVDRLHDKGEKEVSRVIKVRSAGYWVTPV